MYLPPGSKRKRCGECEGCSSDDCGQCKYCRDMKRFGGPGRLKKSCILKKCKRISVNSSGTSNTKLVTDHTSNQDNHSQLTLPQFLRQCGRKLRDVTGDGSCFFRAISFELFGNKQFHEEVRTLITRFENLNTEVFRKKLMPGVNQATIEAHIKNLLRPFTWATHVEVMATATLFDVAVYYCTLDQSGSSYRWEVFEPIKVPNYQFKIPVLPFPEEILPNLHVPHHFEVSYTHNHYTCVDTNEICTTPPLLCGPTVHYSDVL